MSERGDDLGFAPKAFELLAILGQTLVQELDRDAAAKAFLYGLVDRPHTSAPKLFAEAVATAE